MAAGFKGITMNASAEINYYSHYGNGEMYGVTSWALVFNPALHNIMWC